MTIIETNYKENKEIIWEKLAEFAAEQMPDMMTDAEEMKMEHKENKEISLVYKEGDTILGRIAGYIDYGYFAVRTEAFAIEKEARGKGVGRKLLKALEEIAINEGCTTAFVDTISFSAPEFYKKQGYSLIGTLDDYPLEGERYYFMVKRLNKEN